MATSPLFGWEEPDDTDLVKDGAAAIRTLGNAIDTSMGDLLGGTTGQVLSKASNTNMDFTWVTSDDANAIQNTIVDAKGDLISATGSDVPARLAVGANDTMLVADSTAATGLSYKSAATLYPWATWSPTVSGITKGNGVERARYAKIGKTVFFNYSFTLGSTSAVTGNFSITLPSTAANAAYNVSSWADDAGVAAYPYVGVPYTTYTDVYPIVASGTYASGGSTSSTNPFTWGTNDNIRIAGQYEEA
jgi:hypothetical protein